MSEQIKSPNPESTPEIYQGITRVEEIEIMPPSFEQEAGNATPQDFLTDPKIETTAYKPEILAMPEVNSADRHLIGALGAAALIGNVFYTGTKEVVGNAVEVAKQGGRIAIKGLGIVAVALGDELRYRTGNLFERLGKRSYGKHQKRNDDLLKLQLGSAKRAAGNSDTETTSERLAKMEEILQAGTHSRFGRLAEIIDGRNSLKSQVAVDMLGHEIAVGKAGYEAAEKKALAEKRRELGERFDAVASRLSSEAKTAKATGNRQAYEDALQRLGNLTEKVERSRIRHAMQTERLQTTLDTSLEKITSEEDSLAHRSLNEAKLADAGEEMLKERTREWLDPLNILGLKRLVEYKIWASRSPGAVRMHPNKILHDELIAYLGATPEEYADNKRVPEGLKNELLRLIHLPENKLEQLWKSQKRQNKPKQPRKAA